ncbi:MAG: hypothetical protein KUG69_08755 [Marinosulfonomonas sp.]|nr:hypothetical protein [Marinosulfonomonas sp.]
MADIKQMQFGMRLKRIDQHHRSLAKGYVTSINHDGLIIAKPHRRASRAPLRGIFLCLFTLIMFKGFLFAQLGETAYGDRLASLDHGTILEKVGAYIMTADPATVWISERIQTYI